MINNVCLFQETPRLYHQYRFLLTILSKFLRYLCPVTQELPLRNSKVQNCNDRSYACELNSPIMFFVVVAV